MNDKQMMNCKTNRLENVEKALPLQRLTPAVDIYETLEELVLQADLPGVDEQGLQLEIARGVLTLEAEQATAEGAVRNSYYRQFKLPERLDTEAGEAALKDGVLTLRLPKTEAAKPQKIAVKTLH